MRLIQSSINQGDKLIHNGNYELNNEIISISVFKKDLSMHLKVKVLFAHSCLTLCDPMDCSLPGSSVWNSPDKNTGVVSQLLLQGIFLTQGLNPGLLHSGRFFTIGASTEALHLMYYVACIQT